MGHTKEDQIDKLRARAKELADRIGMPEYRLRIPSSRTDWGAPHVEFHGGTYFYVITERGSELERRRAADSDELLYWFFGDATFDMASDFELANRVDGQDSRRLLFAKQIELMTLLDANWGRRCRRELDDILLAHPFNDDLTM